MHSTNLNGHSWIDPLPYDEIQMLHGNPDLYMKESEEILITPDDSDVGYFVEVDLRYPENLKKN